ncbi:hypothetical protein ACFVXE_08265 [Streptomyces sp. NPDC058231]|uniref:hypothetical protein n=1 Tax=Streptomyces sp. NPDC058231 TaxID=3346392 RepID=UPI0036E2F228
MRSGTSTGTSSTAGTFVPDGEQVMEPDKFNVFDVPREQWIVGGIMMLVVVFGLLYRFG